LSKFVKLFLSLRLSMLNLDKEIIEFMSRELAVLNVFFPLELDWWNQMLLPFVLFEVILVLFEKFVDLFIEL
jgi:hypothetical protein